MTISYLGTGGTDGDVCFQSGEKGGFFGLAAPVVKPVITAVGTTTATTTLTELRVTRLYTALVSLGLVGTGG